MHNPAEYFLNFVLLEIVPYLVLYYLIRNITYSNRCPDKLYLKCVLWGIAGAFFPSALVQFAVMRLFHVDIFFMVVVLGPIQEELLKSLFLLVALNNFKYRNVTNGLVLGSLVGLGFALAENIFYVSQGVSSYTRLFLGSFHILQTGLAGGIIAYGMLNKRSKTAGYFIFSIVLTSILHIMLNYISAMNYKFALMYLILFGIHFLFYFGILLKFRLSENQIILRELHDEVRRNIIPENTYAGILRQLTILPQLIFPYKLPKALVCGGELAFQSYYEKKMPNTFYKVGNRVKKINLFRLSN